MFLENLPHLGAVELLCGVGVYYAECNGVVVLSECYSWNCLLTEVGLKPTG